MSEQDSIFREVDEDYRREQIAALWNKYGIFILAGAAMIVAIVGGYSAYNWWAERQAAQHGDALFEAIELVSKDKNDEALQAFNKLASETSGGYQALAQLEVAAIDAQEGRREDALAIYDKVASAASDAFLRDYAKLQGAALQVDTATEAELRDRLSGLITDKNPWRYSARELLALAAYRSGNVDESEKMYGQILGDASAPAELRRRAEAMLALLFKAAEPAKAHTQGSENSPTQ